MTTTTNPTGRTVAAVERLTKRYGSHTAVDDLSFEVPAGDVIGLIGPNGAGKTTAMKMLLGLVRPTSGDVQLLGVRLGDAGFGHALRRTGALIEAPAIYERLTAQQNLELQAKALGVRTDGRRIHELLELVDLADRATDRSGGYSLGMKQRLGIAIALIGSPAMIILDEPANGLDPAGIVAIRHLLRRLPEIGTTVLVSSHQLSEVEQASDSLLVLSNGRLIAAGTTEEILSGRQSNHYTVVVRPEERDIAVAILDRTPAELNEADQPTPGADTLVVELPTDWNGRDLNRALSLDGIHAAEIYQHKVNLEDAFLDIAANEKVLNNA
ncbi:MAG: ATP-binding cassette domain-containing protein [Actinomycetota bacterium]|nr:ATP-binding cassette domain-containing protein [Actinomycetota bacterium]